MFRLNSAGAEWVNWIGEFSCGPGVTIERPTSLSELQSAVKKHSSVRAAATGHSFNLFACPADEKKGAVIDMTAFKSVEVVVPPRAKCEDCADGEPFEVKAEAGLKMGQLQNTLLARGLTLRVPPGNSAYTLGGCIATGCHNLGQSHAQDLLAVTFVLHNGTLREVKRGEPDFDAAAVSLGRLGIILSATLEVLPYRSLQWSAEQLPMPKPDGIWKILKNMTARQVSRETVGNKLVFYLATEVMMMEHWIPTGRALKVEAAPEPLKPYINPQGFRLGQGAFSSALATARQLGFGLTPPWLLGLLQIPAEMGFRGLHSSPLLAGVRKVLGWQHSPEARGEASVRPTGNQYTWAGWIDETMNLFMGLRHVEVIFPLEPKEQAIKCLNIVIEHKHLAWWRLNVRTQRSEGFWLSSTHASSEEVAKGSVFLRVDFVGPGALLDMPSGEASLTARLHADCPGWRKHWGKALFTTSLEERWGEPETFMKAAARWDPSGKFKPKSSPKWLDK